VVNEGQVRKARVLARRIAGSADIECPSKQGGDQEIRLIQIKAAQSGRDPPSSIPVLLIRI